MDSRQSLTGPSGSAIVTVNGNGFRMVPGFTRRFSLTRSTVLGVCLVLGIHSLGGITTARITAIQPLSGTLVVAVPVRSGLVVCSDKRLYNEETGGITDDFVKIKQINENALFVATNTIGFLDKTQRRIEFNVYEIVSRYLAEHPFSRDRSFWQGVRTEIRNRLLEYLHKRSFEEWPETDLANNKLLFNLVFYTIGDSSARSHSLSVFYEKAPNPVVYIPDVVSETVRTPKLSGKGKDVMAYLARDPSLSRDPFILRFDQRRFDQGRMTIRDAFVFAEKLFVLANTRLPLARVSRTFDCASLSHQDGFQWLDASVRSAVQRRRGLTLTRLFSEQRFVATEALFTDLYGYSIVKDQ